MKILVIDDEYLVRYTLARILRGNGYEVATAADGERGIGAFRSFFPDLVITDIIMPRREGIETIRDMRKERPDTKIIAISGDLGSGDYDVLAIARQLGADDTLRKPFDAATLLSAVRRLSAPIPADDGVAA